MGNLKGPITPPGWYPDPDNSLQKRYWSGTAWTDQVSTDPDGADAWQQRSGAHTPRAESRISVEPQPGTPASSASKWVIGIVVAIVLIVGLQSCENRGWQMGVDGNGYQVTCQDGTISMSGGIQGACSHHGGVK